MGPLARASTRSRPSARRSSFGSAAASTTLASNGKNDAVGRSMPASAAAGTNSLTSRSEAAKRVSNPAACGRRSRTAANSGGRRRIGSQGGGADRQVERQLCLARNADIRADQPVGVRFEVHGAAGVEVRRRGDRHQEIGRSVIPVIADRAEDEAFRHGPGDLAGAEPGRQVPGDLGRQAGIAGVAPVRCASPARYRDGDRPTASRPARPTRPRGRAAPRPGRPARPGRRHAPARRSRAPPPAPPSSRRRSPRSAFAPLDLDQFSPGIIAGSGRLPENGAIRKSGALPSARSPDR